MTANEEIIWDMVRAIQNTMRRRVLAGLTELPPWRNRKRRRRNQPNPNPRGQE